MSHQLTESVTSLSSTIGSISSYSFLVMAYLKLLSQISLTMTHGAMLIEQTYCPAIYK